MLLCFAWSHETVHQPALTTARCPCVKPCQPPAQMVRCGNYSQGPELSTLKCGVERHCRALLKLPADLLIFAESDGGKVWGEVFWAVFVLNQSLHHEDQAADAVAAATRKFSPCLEALVRYIAGMLLGSDKKGLLRNGAGFALNPGCNNTPQTIEKPIDNHVRIIRRVRPVETDSRW